MRRSARLLGLAALLLAGPADASAQAGLSLVGLGRPVEPTDARVRALGGAGVVTHGRNLSLWNPAALTRVPSAGVLLGVATEDRGVEGDLAQGDVRGTRFPVGQLVYPIAERWVVGGGFGAFLDQDWLVSFQDSVLLAEDTVPFTEDRSSSGGVSHLRGSVAWIASGLLQIGLALDLYAGDVTRAVSRRFDDLDAGFATYRDRARWEYRGWGWTGGLVLVPDPDLLLGAVVSWADDLKATRDSIPERTTFPMPMRVDLGGSWRLTNDATWFWRAGFASWSRAADALPGGAEDTWSVGSGLELALFRTETSTYAVRGGYRRRALPFTNGGEQGSEFAWTLGVGGRFADGLVTLDGALEFGRRGDLDSLRVRESFRRFSFSLAVYQRSR